MKVLMIDHYLPKSIYSLELSKMLAKHVDLTLATSRYFKKRQREFRLKSIFETEIKSSKTGLFTYALGNIKEFFMMLFGNYDIVHVQTFKKMMIEYPMYVFMKKVRKQKIVYTAHNILPHEDNAREAKMLQKWYRLCDAIIVHNEQSRTTLAKFCPAAEKKIRVIAHGTYNFYEGKIKELPHEKLTFLQFGMIRKYKGIDLLIKAASLLPEDYKEKIMIVIAGKHEKALDNTDYEAMIRENHLESCITFRSEHIPDDAVPELFNSADVCLFPYYEIYGSGALLMAYTFEKPVIASEIPTFVEETDGGKTGLLFENSNPQAFADAMIAWANMSENEIGQFKSAIKSLCTKKYSWDMSAEHLVNVYGELL